MTLDSVMTAIATTAPPKANSLRTRALATIRLRPATRMPATVAIRAVLVCVRSRMAPATTTTSRVTRPRRWPQSQSTTTSPIVTPA